MTEFPEQYGNFRFHPPANEGDGWGIAEHNVWIPVMLADRPACVALADLLDVGGFGEFEVYYLRDTYNRATPSVLVTREHIMEKMPRDR